MSVKIEGSLASEKSYLKRHIDAMLEKINKYTGLSKNMSARLRELATELGASSHNLADVFLDIPV